MADISLQDYIDKLDTLLEQNGYNEVVYHARHIINRFPKNLAAFRLLGRSLMLETRWEEAGEVLQRVLSVQPDDANVHNWLAQVYQRIKQPERVIWHLERVFDHEPNDTTVIDNLRELYRNHRNREVGKLRLTTGAVARQFSQNHQHDQAISLLRDALSQTPQRVDLRLQLARTLMQAGRDVDAAEVAFELLRQLPDCLEANAILAQIWMAEGRPSDAQRYISRIEALDPYLALELARGKQPDPDEITLQELDYQSVARRDLTTENPDWLAVVDDVPLDMEQIASTADEDSDSLDFLLEDDGSADDLDLSGSWLDADEDIDTMPAQALTPEAEDDQEGFGDLFGDDLGGADALLTEDAELPAIFSEFDESESVKPDEHDTLNLPSEWIENDAEGDDDLAFRFEDAFELGDDLDESDDIPALPDIPRRTGRTGLLSALDGDDEQDESETAESDDVLPELPAGMLNDSESVDASVDAADALDWLQETDSTPNVVPEDDDNVEADALSWLSADISEADDASELATDSNDPLAWLHDSGIEVVENEAAAYDPFGEPDELEDPAETAANPLAWLHDSGVEVIDEESDEILALGPPATVEDDGDEGGIEFEADPLSWLHESDAEINEDEDAAGAIPPDAGYDEGGVEPEAGSPVAMPLNEFEADEEPNWMDDSDLLDEMLDMEALSTGEAPSVDLSAVEPDGLLDDETGSSAEFGFDEEEDVEDSGPYLLEEPDQDDEMPVQSDDSFPDWLDSGDEDDSDLEWLSGGGEDADEDTGSGPVALPDAEATADDDVPSWLSGDSPFDDDEDAEETADDWLSSDAETTPDDVAEEVSESVPEWLSASAPVGSEDDDSSPEDVSSEDVSFNWDDDSGSTLEDTPSWLSELGAEDAEDDDGAVSEEADGLFEEEEDQPEWMSSLGDEADFEDAGDEPDWLSDLGGADEADEDAVEAFDTPEWLADAAPVSTDDTSEGDDAGEDESDVAEEYAVADTTFDAEPLSFADDEDAEVEAEAEEVPDWLSGIGDDAGEDDFVEYEPESTEDDEEMVPDWLAAAAPTVADEPEEESADEFFASTPTADIAGINWGDSDELTDDGDDQGVFDEQDELEEDAFTNWADESSNEDDVMIESPAASFVFEDEPGDEMEAAPADNAPDWLNTMVPGLDIDYEAEEDSPIEESYVADVLSDSQSVDLDDVDEMDTVPIPAGAEFDWLTRIVDDELRPPGPMPEATGGRRRFTFSKPPVWLRDEAPADPVDDLFDDELGEDLPPWLDDLDED